MPSLPIFPDSRELAEFITHLSAGDPHTLQLLPKDATHQEPFFEAIQHHGFAALAHRWLKRAGLLAQIPADLTEPLETEAYRQAAQNVALAHELRMILLACAQAGIRCVPLRGLALAECLHGDLSARPLGDLDLLIPRRNGPAVVSLLQERGYRLVDRRPGFAQEFANTFELFKDEPIHAIVEPHWTIVYPPFVDRLDMETVWIRCARGQFLDVDVERLSDEDLLLNLCAHLAHHGRQALLLWVYEIAELIRKQQTELDWDYVLRTGDGIGLTSLLRPGLSQAHALFEAPVPTAVLHPTADSVRSVSSAVRIVGAENSGAGKESLALLLSVHGAGARWRYIKGLLFPSREFMQLHYGLSHRWQVWWWYPRRAVALGVQAARGLWATVSGN